MGKRELKAKKLERMPTKAKDMADRLGITVEELFTRLHLLDTDRQLPKAEGGTYEPSNYDVKTPVDHMKRHGTFRERTPTMEEMKAMVDDRIQAMRLRNKVANQLTAYERKTDVANTETRAYLESMLLQAEDKLASLTKKVEDAIVKVDDPLVKAALGVAGVGALTVATCYVYIDLEGVYPDKDGDGNPHPRAGQEKARHASSLWAYAGLDKPSHDRYEKNVRSGGNKTLRTTLYLLADVQAKMNGAMSKPKEVGDGTFTTPRQNPKGAYNDVYSRTKTRLEQSDKLVGSGGKNSRNTQGQLVEVAWKDAKPSHRDGAAKRAVMKAFLADWWFVGRDLKGLDTNPLYAIAVLGHQGHRWVNPAERGWVWKPGVSKTAAA